MCVHVCVYVCMHVCMSVPGCGSACVYVFVGVCMCVHVYACVCMHVCWVCMYVCVPTYMHAYVCAHICPCSWPPGGGHPVNSTKAQLRRRTRVFQGRLHLRPSPSTAEAKGQTLVKSPDELLPPSHCHGDIKPSTIWGSDGWFLVLCLEKQ